MEVARVWGGMGGEGTERILLSLEHAASGEGRDGPLEGLPLL